MASPASRRERLAQSLQIDVLSFPPDAAALRRSQTVAASRWRELERRARIALFFGAGMFLAWAADVGAAFEMGDADGSTLFGVASVPIAIIVVIAHVYGQWAVERARRGLAQVWHQYSDVTQREAVPLVQLARENVVVAQYLRCVGRQGRALRRLERVALHAWVSASGATRPAPVHSNAA